MSRGRPLCRLPQNLTCYSDGPLSTIRVSLQQCYAMAALGCVRRVKGSSRKRFLYHLIAQNVDDYVCSLSSQAHASIHPSSSVQTSIESSGSSGSAYDKALRLL